MNLRKDTVCSSDWFPPMSVTSSGLPGVKQLAVPAEAAAACYHEWIKQPDGSQLCWKCGAEKAAAGGNVKDREPRAGGGA